VDLTISRPVRIFALVAVVAMVGGIGLLMLKPKSNPVPPVVSSDASAQLTKILPHATKTPTRSSTAKPPAITRAAKARPAVTTTGAAKQPTKPKAAALVAADGLPMALAKALHKHAIVVVSVFDPQSQTDSVSYAEARAGAAEAGAGFVGISVLDSVAAGALTTVLPGGGLLPSPGVLVYRRPDLLVYRIDGFTDRDTVAQAAAASVGAAPVGG
jgi:hypothetical protein